MECHENFLNQGLIDLINQFHGDGGENFLEKKAMKSSQ
jgi:hypothetical protein